MTVRVPVAPAVVSWALGVTHADQETLRAKYRIDQWIAGATSPTLKQLQQFAASTGIGFGYFLLTEPPEWRLPIPDFREGFDAAPTPSADLIAVLSQSQRRTEWYRDYAVSNGAQPLEFVGSAAAMTPETAAAAIRSELDFEVTGRQGSWTDTRKALLLAFEELGGLSVATSMVENNTHRLLDENEFRGFALVDPIAPLVFVNTNQTLNGQLFTLAHEFAHVWRGSSGVGNEEPRRRGQSEVERWCNHVAAEVLVPTAELRERYPVVANRELTVALDALAHDFKCGTLVILQALDRTGLRRFKNFDQAYDTEVARLRRLQNARPRAAGGDPYNSLPFRIGSRLSRALIADAMEGRTSFSEAMRLMSVKSLSTFDEYARRLGAA